MELEPHEKSGRIDNNLTFTALVSFSAVLSSNHFLFFLNIDNIKDDLIKLEFIESYEVRKIYPNKLRIKIFEKNPIAILEYKKEKFF